MRICALAVAATFLTPWEGEAQEQAARSFEVIARAATPIAARDEPPPTGASARLRARAVELGALLEVPLDNPCIETAGHSCARTALSAFFAELDLLREKKSQQPTVVTVLGNSLIASDHIVDVVRARLVERFGSGGRGFLLVDRMAPYGRRDRTGEADAPWNPRTIADMKPAPPFPFSFGGVLHSPDKPARSVFALGGETRAVLHWLDYAGAGTLVVHVNGVPVFTATPSSPTPRQALTTLDLPADAGTLELRAQPGAVVYGLSLERQGPGAVLDTLGVPAVDASLFLGTNEEMFVSALASRNPRLVGVLLGGNETKRVAWGKSTRDKVTRDLSRLLSRVHRAVPDASCLVIGPIDAVRGGKNKLTAFVPRPELPEINQLQRRVALASGCAYFDLFAAMGGRGSLKRFHEQKLLHADLVHPRAEGLDVLGELISHALFDAYAKTPAAQDSRALAAAWSEVKGALVPETSALAAPRADAMPGTFVVRGGGPRARALQQGLSALVGARNVVHWSLDGAPPSPLLEHVAWVVLAPEQLETDADRASWSRSLELLRKSSPRASCLLWSDERALPLARELGCALFFPERRLGAAPSASWLGAALVADVASLPPGGPARAAATPPTPFDTRP